VGSVAFATLFFLISILLSPTGGGLQKARESAAMQTTRTLALAMFQYANDNNAYPDGRSSTEVFQKLLDGNYVSDPAILYVPMPGKTKCLNGSRLQLQNVCYDVTSGIQMNSPDDVPLVFLTGFRIDYRRGGTAVSLVRPFPEIHHGSSSWWQSINGGGPFEPVSGLPVTYKSNASHIRAGQIGADGIGRVPNVIPPDFDANGQIYHQLTPEGPLK